MEESRPVDMSLAWSFWAMGVDLRDAQVFIAS